MPRKHKHQRDENKFIYAMNKNLRKKQIHQLKSRQVATSDLKLTTPHERVFLPPKQNALFIPAHTIKIINIVYLLLILLQTCEAQKYSNESSMCKLQDSESILLRPFDAKKDDDLTQTAYWLFNASGAFFGSRTTSTLKQFHSLPMYKPVLTSFIKNDTLAITNEMLFEIVNTGFFQVLLPDDLMPSINIILKFLTSFSDTEKYTTTFNQEHPDVAEQVIQGFMVDNKKIFPGEKIGKQQNQVWRLNLKKGKEHDFWKYFPQEVADALEHYKNFKIKVLNDILNKIGINSELQEELTCGVSTGSGDEYALFNDFRTENIDAETGLKQHKDYGIITALCSPVYRHSADVAARSGLEALIEVSGKTQWVSVVPAEKSIIFNFGSALEKALFHFPINIPGFPSIKLKAAVHRVILSLVRRYSVANFGDPSLQSLIPRLWKINGKQVLKEKTSYLDHCLEENKKLYGL